MWYFTLMMSLFNAIPRSRAELIARARSLQSSAAAASAFWVLMASGGNQIIRLAGNLILTRLLYPEIFGIMAIVTAVMVGLGQISDVGLREGVVNSDRINDPNFMRTAWTLQILRTGLIALLACFVAWPLAIMYDEPVLAPVLIMISCATFLTGFKSIALLAYDKRLDIKVQMGVDLCVQLSGLVVVLIWSWLWPSVWALVAGQLFSSILEVILSYVLFKGHHSKFGWDKLAVKQLFGYGKWIFLSSTISYITVQGDRLIMGGFLSMAELGKYSVAATWASIVTLLSVNFSTRVLHPYFRMAIEHHADFSKIQTVRNLLNTAYMCVCVGLALIGDWLILFMYDDRYAAAGWMLQILALGQLAKSFTGTLMPFMLANGDSFSQMKFSAASAVILIGFILLGGYLAGPPGVIIAYSLSGIVAHPVMIAYAKKHGFICFWQDFALLLIALVICGIGWWLTDASVITVIGGLIHDFRFPIPIL